MARPRKKPDYDPEKLMNELLDIVVDEYKKTLKTVEHKGEIKTISEELEIAPHKVRKLLITAGLRDGKEYYNSPSCNQVLSLHKKGKTVTEIMDLTGLNRTSVCCYLPYSKGLYNMVYGSYYPKHRLVEFDLREAREIRPDMFVDPENM